ncbi:hypothetical protein NHX12_022536 [Muraenolepis orangiensis]|uniref:Uncharacterized protein n=1 Tax=Muraenolepis orangiensis TaxID=630683 RepID=A0A9Q0ENE2_9TELE|nr:hypothetical protein NHX12_022536 [Muraenolepis orangiensis]
MRRLQGDPPRQTATLALAFPNPGVWCIHCSQDKCYLQEYLTAWPQALASHTGNPPSTQSESDRPAGLQPLAKTPAD